MPMYPLNIAGTSGEITSNRISAGEFIEKQYGCPVPRYKDMLSCYKYLTEFQNEDAVFKDTASTYGFFTTLNKLYGLLLNGLYSLILDTQYTVRDLNFGNLVVEILRTRPALEPATKIFIEDMYNTLYRKKRTSLLSNVAILGTSIRDYNLTSHTPINITVEPVTGNDIILKRILDGKDTTKLLAIYGLQHTVSILHLMLGIVVHYGFISNRDTLDRYQTRIETHRLAHMYLHEGTGGFVP